MVRLGRRRRRRRKKNSAESVVTLLLGTLTLSCVLLCLQQRVVQVQGALESQLSNLRRTHSSTELKPMVLEQIDMLQGLRDYQQKFHTYRPDRAAYETTSPPRKRTVGGDLQWQYAENLLGYSGIGAGHHGTGLAADEVVEVKVRVDIVFIGFEADGGQRFSVPHSVLEKWFEHLPKAVKHVSLSKPDEASHEGFLGESVNVSKEVQYSYQFHVVEVGNLVLDALESSMRLHLRRDWPEEEMDEHLAEMDQHEQQQQQQQQQQPLQQQQKAEGGDEKSMRGGQPLELSDDSREKKPAAETVAAAVAAALDEHEGKADKGEKREEEGSKGEGAVGGEDGDGGDGDGSPHQRRRLTGEDGVGKPKSSSRIMGKQYFSYLSSWHMEKLLGSLVDALQGIHVADEYDQGDDGLGIRFQAPGDDKEGIPPAYTLFVLNPRRNHILSGIKDELYGYRWGYGFSDMLSLVYSPDVMSVAEEEEKKDAKLWRKAAGGSHQSLASPKKKLGRRENAMLADGDDIEAAKRGKGKLRWTDGADVTNRWAMQILEEMKGTVHTDIKEEVMALLTDDKFKGRRTLLVDLLNFRKRGDNVHSESSTGEEKDEEELDEGQIDRRLEGGVSGGRGGGSSGGGGLPKMGDSFNDCLSEVWTTNSRFGWVDLQAGPFKWGSTVGGSAFKSYDTIPRVPETTNEGRGGGVESMDKKEEEQEEDHFMDDEGKEDERVISYGRRIISNKLLRLKPLVKQMGCIPEDMEHKREGAPSSCRALMGEIALLETFKKGTVLLDKLEKQLKADNGDDRSLVQVLGEVKAVHADLYIELRELVAPLSEDDDVHHHHAGDHDSPHHYHHHPKRQQEHLDVSYFLAKLAALVSSLSRHVITPPTSFPLPYPPYLVRQQKIKHFHVFGPLQSYRYDDDDEEDKGKSAYGRGGGGSDGLTPLERLIGVGAGVGVNRGYGDLVDLGPNLLEYAAKSRPWRVPMPSAKLASSVRLSKAISFTVFLLKDHQAYNPLEVSEGGFDMLTFQKEVLSLRMPSQDSSFTFQQMNLADDPALAMAFASAMQESVVSVFTAQGKRKSVIRRWVNSGTIYEQLKIADTDHYAQDGTTTGLPLGGKDKNRAILAGYRRLRDGSSIFSSSRFTKHVTVFILSVSGATPVYVDEWWQARALGDDMVLAVQSEPIKAETRLACGYRTVHTNPRNPIRQTLAAVSMAVGGLVPTHLGYSEAKVAHCSNWLWSMSESPLSPIVSHAHFGLMDKDHLYRAHSMQALAASVVLTKATRKVLHAVVVDKHNRQYEGVVDKKVENLQAKERQVQHRREEILSLMERLDFASAAHHLNPLVEESTSLYNEAVDLAEIVLKTECIDELLRKRSDDVTKGEQQHPSLVWEMLHLLTATATTLAAALFLWLVVRHSVTTSQRSKAKIRVN